MCSAILTQTLIISTHELILVDAVSEYVPLPVSIVTGMRQLCNVVCLQAENEEQPCIELQAGKGSKGRPKFQIQREKQDMSNTQLPVPYIAQLQGVSERTLFRRFSVFRLSVRGSYSTVSDEELDNLVMAIIAQMPNVGYRLVMGGLKSLGHRIQ